MGCRERRVDDLTTTDTGSGLHVTVFGAMQRHRLLVAITVVVCGAMASLLAGAQGPKATATASLVLQDPRVNLPNSSVQPSTFVADQVAIMKLPMLSQT